MYSRNFRPQTQNPTDSVPVQSFGDSFSADAFLNDMARRSQEHESAPTLDERNDRARSQAATEGPDQKSENPAVSTSEKKTRFPADDLLLIGVLFLCLNDAEKSEDLLLPLLIAVLLLS